MSNIIVVISHIGIEPVSVKIYKEDFDKEITPNDTFNFKNETYELKTSVRTDYFDFNYDIIEPLNDKLNKMLARAPVKKLYIFTNIEDDFGDIALEIASLINKYKKLKIYISARNNIVPEIDFFIEYKDKIFLFCDTCQEYIRYSDINDTIRKEHDH